MRAGIDESTLGSVIKEAEGDDDLRAELQSMQDNYMAQFLGSSWYARFFFMVCAVHPWLCIWQYSAFISHAARVTLAIAELMGALAMNAVFFQTSGGALSNQIPDAEACRPREGFWTEFVQSVTV